MSLSLDPRTMPSADRSSDLPSPPAARANRRTWRDPRFAVGILLVGGSVLTGAQLLASADDTVTVLAARGPLVAGQELDAADLATVSLRFTAEQDADRYLAAGDDVEGSVLLRPVGAGELVPRSALGADTSASLAELPLAVEPGRVPATVRTGDLVDVWAGPAVAADVPADGSGDDSPAAQLLLEAVPVLALSADDAATGAAQRRVVVGVAPDDEQKLSRVVARLGGGVLVVRRPG